MLFGRIEGLTQGIQLLIRHSYSGVVIETWTALGCFQVRKDNLPPLGIDSIAFLMRLSKHWRSFWDSPRILRGAAHSCEISMA